MICNNVGSQDLLGISASGMLALHHTSKFHLSTFKTQNSNMKPPAKNGTLANWAPFSKISTDTGFHSSFHRGR